MASGKQIAEQNLQLFQTWLASKTDADFRQMVSRGVLSRKEMAKECGFAKSALDQNPRIKATLKAVEDGLRDRGILPALEEKLTIDGAAPPMREMGQQRAARDSERLKRLELENASLRAEKDELRRENTNLRAEKDDLKRQLERYAVLEEALSLTGRLPR
ncbi:VPA1267 family protein [Paraburkholderia sp. FT54]|uniref:VPA1267 family protein n=1 Tax=Paraburkholderia sp. FT54 TaxID=3074437 RepID=UPI002877E0A4|nr:VPA1267 family protein [Paraburkholderia sp. FT54]WNC89440.1 VPA1267 family protein [Paraburkholderia sp. FT54]